MHFHGQGDIDSVGRLRTFVGFRFAAFEFSAVSSSTTLHILGIKSCLQMANNIKPYRFLGSKKKFYQTRPVPHDKKAPCFSRQTVFLPFLLPFMCGQEVFRSCLCVPPGRMMLDDRFVEFARGSKRTSRRADVKSFRPDPLLGADCSVARHMLQWAGMPPSSMRAEGLMSVEDTYCWCSKTRWKTSPTKSCALL